MLPSPSIYLNDSEPVLNIYTKIMLSSFWIFRNSQEETDKRHAGNNEQNELSKGKTLEDIKDNQGKFKDHSYGQM